MSRFQTPVLPYVESRGQGRKQTPRSIIIRSSHTTSDKGAALGLAGAWHRGSSNVKASHYAVDMADSYRCAFDRVEAEQSPKRGALHVTLCAEPQTHLEAWDDSAHAKVLDRAVDLIAQLSLAYKIPIRHLDQDGYEKWAEGRLLRPKGIMFYIVGEFPKEAFLTNVRAQAAFFKTSL